MCGMEMKPLHAGKLRAAGYDRTRRELRVRLEDGSTLSYQPVSEEMWRKLSTSASAWSYYRDVIEEEFTAQRVTSATDPVTPKRNPLDDLFG